MTQQATDSQMNRFVREVDLLMQNHARLQSPQVRETVYGSGDQALIDDYESTLSKVTALKNTVEATTGAWNTVRDAYKSATATTSIWINDAIDELKSWWQGNGLGAIQVPAAAWVAGIIGAAYLLNKGVNKLMVKIDAAKIQRETGVPYATALDQATRINAIGGFFSWQNSPLIIGGLVAALLIWRAWQ